MKLVDIKSNATFNDLYLFLTKDEASAFNNELEKLLKNPEEKEIKIYGEDIEGKLTKIIKLRISN
ncbi:MAG: hypothetical protein ABIY50_10220 [Ignavibacteria bacterium]